MKLSVGDQMRNFDYSTPYKEKNRLTDYVNGKTTAIFFLRYYGCTLCQLKLHELKNDYPLFAEKRVNVLVVLQSKPENISESVKEGFFPFDIVCDQDQLLYKEFDIEPATSKIKLGAGNTVKEVVKATAKGFKHGEYEGNELQLPATFVIDKNLIIKISHYGQNGADVLSTNEILDNI